MGLLAMIKNTTEILLPKYVGGYKITPNFYIHLQHKPKWFTRKMHKLLLNWEWFDIKETCK